MKRLLYVFLLMMALASCKNDQEDNFGQTPTERKTAAISELTTTLSGSEYGWKTTIVIHGTQVSAGDFFVMKFAPIEGASSGQVTIANGFNSKTSEFEIYHATGVVLNFNSFNEVFHWLSRPLIYGFGLGGNNEYIFIKEENGKLFFKGKENSKEIILEKATAQDWDMTDIQKSYANVTSILSKNFTGVKVTKGFGATAENPFSAKFRDVVYITKAALPDKKGQFYGMDYLVNGKQVQNHEGNFIFTHNELILAKPLVMGSDTVDRFVYNKDRNLWVITNKGVEGYIYGIDLPPTPSPGAFDIFIRQLGLRFNGWRIWYGQADYGKIGEYLTQIRNNVPELQCLYLSEHCPGPNRTDLGRGFLFTGADGRNPYAFIPIDYIKLGESEMKIVRNGEVKSDIANINELLTTNPYVLKLMNSLFNPKGWSLFMQQGGTEKLPYWNYIFYDMEDPSIHMTKVF